MTHFEKKERELKFSLESVPGDYRLQGADGMELLIKKEDIEAVASVLKEPPSLSDAYLSAPTQQRFLLPPILFLAEGALPTNTARLLAATLYLRSRTMHESLPEKTLPGTFKSVVSGDIVLMMVVAAADCLRGDYQAATQLIVHQAVLYPKPVARAIVADWGNLILAIRGKGHAAFSNIIGISMLDLARFIRGGSKALQTGSWYAQFLAYGTDPASLVDPRDSFGAAYEAWHAVSKRYPRIAHASARKSELIGLAAKARQPHELESLKPIIIEYLTGALNTNPLGIGTLFLCQVHELWRDNGLLENPLISAILEKEEIRAWLRVTAHKGSAIDAAAACNLLGHALSVMRNRNQAAYERELDIFFDDLLQIPEDLSPGVSEGAVASLAMWATEPITAGEEFGRAMLRSKKIAPCFLDTDCDNPDPAKFPAIVRMVPEEVLQPLLVEFAKNNQAAAIRSTSRTAAANATVGAKGAKADAALEGRVKKIEALIENPPELTTERIKAMNELRTRETFEAISSMLLTADSGSSLTTRDGLLTAYTLAYLTRESSSGQQNDSWFVPDPETIFIQLISLSYKRIGKFSAKPADSFDELRTLWMLKQIEPQKTAAFMRDLGRLFWARRDLLRPEPIPLVSDGSSWENPFGLDPMLWESAVRCSPAKAQTRKFSIGPVGKVYSSIVFMAAYGEEEKFAADCEARLARGEINGERYGQIISERCQRLMRVYAHVTPGLVPVRFWYLCNKLESYPDLQLSLLENLIARIAEKDPNGNCLGLVEYMTSGLGFLGAGHVKDGFRMAEVAEKNSTVLGWLFHVARSGMAHNATTAISLLAEYIKMGEVQDGPSRLWACVNELTSQDPTAACVALQCLAVHLGPELIKPIGITLVSRAARTEDIRESDLSPSSDLADLKNRNPLLAIITDDDMREFLARFKTNEDRDLAHLMWCIKEMVSSPYDSAIIASKEVLEQSDSLPEAPALLCENTVLPKIYRIEIWQATPHEPGAFCMRIRWRMLSVENTLHGSEQTFTIRGLELIEATPGLPEELRAVLRDVCICLAAEYLTGRSAIPKGVLQTARATLDRIQKLYE